MISFCWAGDGVDHDAAGDLDEGVTVRMVSEINESARASKLTALWVTECNVMKCASLETVT